METLIITQDQATGTRNCTIRVLTIALSQHLLFVLYTFWTTSSLSFVQNKRFRLENLFPELEKIGERHNISNRQLETTGAKPAQMRLRWEAQRYHNNE